jgi:hypothetical protein
MLLKLNQRHGILAICKTLGVSRSLVLQWIARGILRPLRVGDSLGAVLGFSDIDLLAAAVSRELRRRHMPMPGVVAACNWIHTQTLESLQAAWAEGRVFLFIVGKGEPLSRLLSADSIFNNPGVDLKAAARAGLKVWAIDTQAAYTQLCDKLTEMNARGKRELVGQGAADS